MSISSKIKVPFLIGVAGGTASGKSSVCARIMDLLGPNNRRVISISQDSFYRNLAQEENQRALRGDFNFDHPDAFEHPLMMKVLESLRNGKPQRIPRYDFKTNSRLTDEFDIVEPADVIIVEGILVFYDQKLRDMFNMKLFVDADSDIRLARRVERDTRDRGRTLSQVLHQYLSLVKPAFEEFCLPTKKYADVVIPRGVDNLVAIDLIVQHIQEILRSYPTMAPDGTQNPDEDEWNLEADDFLGEPEISHSCKTVNGEFSASSGVVQRQHQRNVIQGAAKQDRFSSEQLEFITATLIDMLAQLAGKEKTETVRRSLSKMIISTGYVSAVHFSDEYKPFRMAIADIIRNIMVSEAGLYRDPFVDQPLSVEHNVTSRYQRDYKELEEIGAGGFGRVYKVKSNLDRQIYAVKKIKIRNTIAEKISLDAVLSEVRILASLSHPSIVRYHVSWFELDETSFPELDETAVTDLSFEATVDIQEVTTSEDDLSSHNDSNLSWASPEKTPKPDLSKFYRGSGDDSTSDSGSVDSNTENESTRQADDLESEVSEISFDSFRNDLALVPKAPYTNVGFGSYTVYIVMELCKWSLENYLKKRNSESLPTINIMDAYTIFEDLLSALVYLHEDSGHTVIHRDIKPSNIFLKATPMGVRALLGDFGLACHQEKRPSDIALQPLNFDREVDRSKTEGIGTIHYAAPEQLRSNSYDFSVDTYSLGLVMYEFFHTAKTDMERVEVLKNIRKTGKASEEFRKRYKTIAGVIESMVCLEPAKRPSARMILDRMLLNSPTTVEKLRRSLRAKDAEINKLRSLLRHYKENCSCGYFEPCI